MRNFQGFIHLCGAWPDFWTNQPYVYSEKKWPKKNHVTPQPSRCSCSQTTTVPRIALCNHFFKPIVLVGFIGWYIFRVLSQNYPTFPISLEVFQPFPIVGCGFVEDAGTNTANEFTGCANEWPGGPQLENRVVWEARNMPFTHKKCHRCCMVFGTFEIWIVWILYNLHPGCRSPMKV